MSALKEIDFSSVSSETNENVIRELVSGLFWTWYSHNTDRKLTTLRVWFIRKTIFVRDLSNIFELLFGPNPHASAPT